MRVPAAHPGGGIGQEPTGLTAGAARRRRRRRLWPACFTADVAVGSARARPQALGCERAAALPGGGRSSASQFLRLEFGADGAAEAMAQWLRTPSALSEVPGSNPRLPRVFKFWCSLRLRKG